jgi:hypothetical protein
MPSKNLWGDLTSIEPVRTPTTVLKEQAYALTKIMKGTLYGKIEVNNHQNRFEIELYITAPTLNNYRFDVVHVNHGIEIYPAKVVASWDRYTAGKEVQCQNEKELIDALGQILGSKQVTHVITSLLSQTKAMKPG